MNRSTVRWAVATSLVAAWVGFAPAVVFAEDTAGAGLGEVIVTAQKRAQNLQDVAISITALSEEDLRGRGITSTEALGAATPGLIVNDYGNPVITVFTLRGAQQFDFGDHQESPVAVFADGSYIPYLSAVGMNMFDLERVEVDRGPQGTLFGRNATGGVVSLISAKPTKDFEGFADLQGGNYGAFRAEAAISGPLSDGIRARLSVLKDQHDGYFKNAIGPDKGDADNTSWRAQIAADVGSHGSLGIIVRGSHDQTSTSPYEAAAGYPDPTTGAIVKGGGQPHVDFCAAYFGTTVPLDSVDCLSGDPAPSDPFHIRHNRIGSFKRDYYGANVSFDWDFGPTQFTSISSFGDLRKRYADEDSDATSLDVLYFGQTVDAKDYSQEFRLAGKNDRLTWVTGAYYLQIDGDYGTGVGFYPFDPTLVAAVDNAYTLKTQSWAAFAQTEFKLAPQFTLTTGFRWTEDRKKFEFIPACSGPGCDPFGLTDPGIVQGSGYTDAVPGAQTRRSSGNWDAKVQLGFQAREGLLYYIGVSRGTKAGGYNAASTAYYTVDQTIFKDEVLTDYEAGIKSQLAGGRVRLNASAFYYDYANIQVFNQLGPSTVTFNRDGRIYGSEIELEARVARGFDLGLGVSLLHTQIDPVDVTNILTGAITQVSQELPNSPHATVNALARKEWSVGTGSIALQANVLWTGDRKLNLIDNPGTDEKSYTVTDLRASYISAGDRWEAAIFVKNATDEKYRIVGTPFVNFTGSIIEIYGPPRTFGGSVRVRF